MFADEQRAVSRETRRKHFEHGAEHPARRALFADTEIPEDHIQNILDIDTAGELAQ